MAGEHDCAAPGCTAVVAYDKLMCIGHWKALPKPIRDKVWSTWRDVHRRPEEYREAREEAVDWHRKNGSGRQGSFL